MTAPDVPETNVAASTGNEIPGVSRPMKDPASQGQPLTAAEIAKGHLDEIDKTVREIDLELAQIASRIEGVGDYKVMEALRSRRRQLTLRRDDLLQERPLWVRKLEHIAREEQRATIELHLTARRNAHHEGVAVAEKLRSALGVVEGLHQQWVQWSETDRRLKDMVRSLAPDRMGQVPDFSWTTGIDGNFTAALIQVIGECHRSESALKTRQKVSA
jgi:hypothetical protein